MKFFSKMKILKRAAGQLFFSKIWFFCAHRNQRVKWQLLSNTPLASKTKMQIRTTLVCTCRCAPHLTCVRLIEWVPSHTPTFNTILQTVREIWKRGVHVRTCKCIPSLTCVKFLSNGSLATHPSWIYSAQPFARYGEGVCTCARADASHLWPV